MISSPCGPSVTDYYNLYKIIFVPCNVNDDKSQKWKIHFIGTRKLNNGIGTFYLNKLTVI